MTGSQPKARMTTAALLGDSKRQATALPPEVALHAADLVAFEGQDLGVAAPSIEALDLVSHDHIVTGLHQPQELKLSVARQANPARSSLPMRLQGQDHLSIRPWVGEVAGARRQPGPRPQA